MQLILKNIKYFFTLIILFTFINSPVAQVTQPPNNSCKTAEMLKAMMDKYHYQPAVLDMEWTSEFLKRMLQGLDPNSLYFTENDFTALKNKYSNIKEIIADNNCTFLVDILKLFKLRLAECDSFLSNVQKSRINFSAKDSITFYFDNHVNFSKDKNALSKKWDKWIKYNVLLYVYNNAENKQQSLKMPEALDNAVKREKNKIARILNYPTGLDNYISESFLNSISSGYDPHSAYFSNTEKNYFASSLSKGTESYGIEFQTNSNDEIIVDHLIPGGPGWKTGKINKGDILVNLKWENDKPLDLYNLTIYDALRVLNEKKPGKLEFTFRKSNGKHFSVMLIKERLEVEENIISGYILNGKKKIGYISLPAFYTELENQEGLGCANDVAKEIVKLKNEKIEGLIVDLRYNGGGSITEAMDLAGIFIDEGPLAITKYRDSKPIALKDFNRGTIYDGPLLIMVNSQSASASELLAASLQDYHRAIIVGNTTFGKASGQNIFPLDTSELPSKNVDQYAKITVSKLYRITGYTCQLKGLKPDIELPDALSAFSMGESKYLSALPSDSVVKKVYYSPLIQPPIEKLAIESKKRINSSKRFNQILALNGIFSKNIKAGKTIYLENNSFQKYQKEMENYFTQADTLPIAPSTLFKVDDAKSNSQVLNYDAYRKEQDENLKKNIQNDIYIDESYQILEDFINLTYKKD
jgi:carboxyl-terminal processing protease